MKNSLLVIFLVCLGFASTFATGFYVSNLLHTENITPMPTSRGIEASSSAQPSTTFLPGKHYFDDSVMMITKNEPHITIAATINRSELIGDYAQSTRVSYFDGKNWVRKTESNTAKDSEMFSNSLLRKWKISYDPSRVLRQSVNGEFEVEGNQIEFETGTLQNEIGMRSIPGYTKFMSRGNGRLKINGETYDSYVLYTRIYSLNAEDIQFYDTPLGVTTDWVAFWDTAGNFYHIDKTSVQKPTSIYQTHEIAVVENSEGQVSKSFSVNATRDNPNNPSIFSMIINEPIQAHLSLTYLNQFNKYPGIPYTWILGQAAGEVLSTNGTKVSGIGLVEYIHD
jgi:hypothetical protein